LKKSARTTATAGLRVFILYCY